MIYFPIPLASYLAKIIFSHDSCLDYYQVLARHLEKSVP